MSRSNTWVLAVLALGAASAGCSALNDFSPFTFGADAGDQRDTGTPDSDAGTDAGNEMDGGTDAGMTCPAGQTLCSTGCVDLRSDEAHCGACEDACATGEVCLSRSCVPACSGGLVDCGGTCVDVDIDTSHCGGCDMPCATGESCVDGACTVPCDPGLTACGGTCVDTATDASNCGSCGMTCDAGDDCVASACLPAERDWHFTPCGATGAVGPTAAACTAAYAGSTLAGEVTVSVGVQSWTVPVSGLYRITATGAQGMSAMTGRRGGLGAQVTGTFPLDAGDVLTILVGQEGTQDGCNGGGGGGSFVTRGGGNLLVVAAGGGGTRTDVLQDGCDGRSGLRGGIGSGPSDMHPGCPERPDGVALGGRASSESWGSGGGGAVSPGGGDCGGTGGAAFRAGGAGGTSGGPSGSVGGFGGGGSGNGCCGGGGGGGYSGGEGGRIAGGGGSYNAGSSQVAMSGANMGAGFVDIMLIERCAASACTFACDAGFTQCGGRCVDTTNDPTACGSCTTTCAPAEVCGASRCMATMGTFVFPSPTSTLDNTSTTTPLGAGGGSAVFRAGSNVRETFRINGLTAVRSMNYSFDMDDHTGAGCPVGTLTFEIVINGTPVGTYSYVGGMNRGRISFSGMLMFAPVSGMGPTSDQYEVRYRAVNAVCPGGGSYNWFAGGSLVLAM